MCIRDSVQPREVVSAETRRSVELSLQDFPVEKLFQVMVVELSLIHICFLPNRSAVPRLPARRREISPSGGYPISATSGPDPQPSHDIGNLFVCLLNTKPPLRDFRLVTLDRPWPTLGERSVTSVMGQIAERGGVEPPNGSFRRRRAKRSPSWRLKRSAGWWRRCIAG